MIQPDLLSLSQLLMTRFCHDITGPIGAINNGVEFMSEGGMEEQAFSLIEQSAEQALARIQFYRFAYGVLKGESETRLDESHPMLEAFFSDGKIAISWDVDGVVVSQQDYQIICNLVMIAAGALIRGGTISLSAAEHSGTLSVTICAEGQSIKGDGDLLGALTHHALHSPDAKTVQAYYTALLIAAQTGAITTELDEEKLVLSYSKDAS